MGASNSTTVIKNGDWEHRLCWTTPSEPSPAPSPIKGNSPDNIPDAIVLENGQHNNNNFSNKRNSSLTKSLRLLKRASPQRGSWQKLKPQASYEETKNGIEMASFNASLSSSVGTTKTEELVI